MILGGGEGLNELICNFVVIDMVRMLVLKHSVEKPSFFFQMLMLIKFIILDSYIKLKSFTSF